MQAKDLPAREMIASSTLIALSSYISLLLRFDDDPQGCLDEMKGDDSCLLLLSFALSLEEARDNLSFQKKASPLAPEDDPLALLPLIRPLADSLALFSLAEQVDDIDLDLLLDADDVEKTLSDQGTIFLIKWGSLTTRRVLEEILTEEKMRALLKGVEAR